VLGQPGEVEDEGEAEQGHAPGEGLLEGERQPPPAGAGRLQEGEGAGGAQGLAAASCQKQGGTAVQHRLGSAETEDEVALHELARRPQGDPLRLAQAHEQLVLHVVHLHAAAEATGEGGGEEALQLAPPRPAGKPGGDEDGLPPVGDAQPA
jgi:hypothetical protein